jgi:hypothetical protein
MPSATITTTAIQAVPPASGRRGLILQNVSDEPIAFAFSPGVTASAGAESGILIEPGESLTLATLPGEGRTNIANSPVWAIHAGAGEKELRYVAI